MGLEALLFGVAATFALAIACCGPNRLAKLLAAYLFAGWLVSNAIAISGSTEYAIERFAYMDCTAAMFLVMIWLAYPSIWLGVLTAALVTQTIFQANYLFGPAEFERDWSAIVVNNALYGLQLTAVTGPTFFRPAKPTPRPRARRPTRIKPPYEGWAPPES